MAASLANWWMGSREPQLSQGNGELLGRSLSGRSGRFPKLENGTAQEMNRRAMEAGTLSLRSHSQSFYLSIPFFCIWGWALA